MRAGSPLAFRIEGVPPQGGGFAMKKKMFGWLVGCALLLTGAAQAQGLSPDQVRSYDEVFALSAQALSRDEIELRWEIADNYYLYNNRFLRIRSATEGVTLGTPELPAGKREFDELLNADVVKYHDEVRVRVPLTQLSGIGAVLPAQPANGSG